ncbi:MAG: hypothetical protein IKG58_01960 [Bacilli bacterium]|nr:hypothetical protein [Bacilli bacterium]MBR3049311.1 hypothetical protein [Bacilli bacterium]
MKVIDYNDVLELMKNDKEKFKKALVNFSEKEKTNKYYKLYSQLIKFSDDELIDMENEYYKKITNRKLNEKEKIKYDIKYIEKSLEDRLKDNYSDKDQEILRILSNIEMRLNKESLTMKDIDRMKRSLVSFETDYNLDISFLTTFSDMYYDILTNKFLDTIKESNKVDKSDNLNYNEGLHLDEVKKEKVNKGRGK